MAAPLRPSWVIGLSAAVLLIAMTVNVIQHPSHQVDPDPVLVKRRVEPNNEYYDKLSRLIQIPTISHENKTLNDLSQIETLYQYLESTYSLFWSKVEIIKIGKLNKIFVWKRNQKLSGADAPLPILLMAHLDVVPAGNISQWVYPPFSGKITDTHVWGRGAIDDKQNVLGILEAATYLMKTGFQPKRDIYISFGYDEEVSGHEGAAVVAQYFRDHNIKFEFINDEGMPIVSGVIGGVSKSIAPVGVSEKGALDVTITLRGEAGHSSMPPPSTLIGIMSRALITIEDHPMPRSFEGSHRNLMEILAPDLPWYMRIVFSNIWLFRPVIVNYFASKPSTNSLIATTTAITIVHGGEKRNVLPDEVKASINFRISPLDSVKAVIDHISNLLYPIDPRFEISIIDSLEPSPVSDPYSPTFIKFAKMIRTAVPDCMVSAGMMVGNTDTRHFWDLSKNIYRFAGNVLTQEDIDTFHGSNERISKANVMNVINFYAQLFMQLD